jgi:hypothetical protein
MTYGDVLVQILSEVSGLPKSQIKNQLEQFKENVQGNHKLDDELSDDEASELLNSLRKEKSGILAWLARGAMDAHKKTGHA